MKCLLVVIVVSFFSLASSLSCGERGVSPPDAQIVGGDSAKKGSWPWMASLTHRLLPGHRFCGASLISQRWAVSAAHCFNLDLGLDGWQIELGKYDDQLDENYTSYHEVMVVSL